ncbi:MULTISPECIES: hypothetical protein, partial [Streptomyces]|uniref:hypothetical protein n=1 Tax=Streptomyces TaxID=1883 RepID=UPI00196671B2
MRPASSGATISHGAVLRRGEAAPEPEVPAPRVVGIDEYAIREGSNYGAVPGGAGTALVPAPVPVEAHCSRPDTTTPAPT